METQATSPEPTREELDAQPGTTLLEFGTAWCGFCRAAQPLIASTLAHHPEVRHIKVEDGPGRRLGRSYRVKLWPTLVLLVDGQEAGRVLRPATPDELEALLALQR